MLVQWVSLKWKEGIGTLKSPDMQELHFQELKKKNPSPLLKIRVYFLKGYVSLEHLK